MRIMFLAHNMYGVGGTVRTVLNLAEALAKDHDVELVSVYRRVNEPTFSMSPNIRLRYLVDGRPGSDDRRTSEYFEPSELVPSTEEMYSQYSKLTDSRIVEFLSGLNGGVVVGTRPSLNLFVAKYTPDSLVKVVQEHMNHSAIDDQTRVEMDELYSRIDSIVCVTNHDADLVRSSLPSHAEKVTCIPNSVPSFDMIPSNGDSKIITTAGRLAPGKRIELLVHAFAKIADDYPDWAVRIYGDGEMLPALRSLAHRLKVSNQVLFMGKVAGMQNEWPKASIAVSSSDAESFGMTLIEAMRAGVPVVSTDCPVGPREIISDGQDGMLVPMGDVDALSIAIQKLMDNDSLRAGMAANAISKGKTYDPAIIAGNYYSLFSTIADSKKRYKESKFDVSKIVSRLRRLRIPAATEIVNRVKVEILESGQIKVSALYETRVQPKEIFVDLTGNASRCEPVKATMPRDPENRRMYCSILEKENFPHDAIWDMAFSTAKSPLKYRHILVDSRRALVDETVSHSRPIRWVVPFVSSKGKIQLRSWKRARHAEVVDATIGDDLVSLKFQLTFVPRGELVLMARRRGDLKMDLVRPLVASDDSWQAQVAPTDLMELRVNRHEDWDFYVQDDLGRVRLGRFLDDVIHKKSVIQFPKWIAEDAPDGSDNHAGEKVAVRPYYNVRNDFSVSVTSL